VQKRALNQIKLQPSYYTRPIRVATNLENLEYSGMSLDMENSWNSQAILCKCTEKSKQIKQYDQIFVQNIVDWVNRIIMSL